MKTSGIFDRIMHGKRGIVCDDYPVKRRVIISPKVFVYGGKAYSTEKCDIEIYSANDFRLYFRTVKGNYFSCIRGLGKYREYVEKIDGEVYRVQEETIVYEDFKVVNEDEFKNELLMTDYELYRENYGELEYA